MTLWQSFFNYRADFLLREFSGKEQRKVMKKGTEKEKKKQSEVEGAEMNNCALSAGLLEEVLLVCA